MTDAELQDNNNNKIIFINISNRKVRLLQTQLDDNQREFGFGHTMCNESGLVRGHFEYIEPTYQLKIN